MSTHRGVETTLLVVNKLVHLAGVAQGGALVQAGGTLTASGVIAGPLTIEAGGSADLSDVANGNVSLEPDARLDVTGVLTGTIVRNDGLLTVAVGSVIHGSRVSDSGTFVSPTSVPIAISVSTPRFRLVGTGSQLSITKKV